MTAVRVALKHVRHRHRSLLKNIVSRQRGYFAFETGFMLPMSPGRNTTFDCDR
jgi:hypothetical protein